MAKKDNKYKDHDQSKYKVLNCRIDWDKKSIQKSAEGNLIIEGFANTSDLDRVGDIVLPSAFEKSLPEYMENPVLLHQHCWEDLIGKILEARIIEDTEEKAGGLWVKAQVSNASDTESVRTKIREGSLKTFSIGYNEIEANYDRTHDCYFVKELELLEISIVTIPANSNAKFVTVEDPEVKLNNLNDSEISKLADALNQLDKTELLDTEFLKELLTIIKED